MRRALWASLPAIVVAVLCSAQPAFADDRIFFLQQHTFSRAEARTRVTQLLEYWQGRFGVKGTWAGDVAHVKGEVMGVPFNGRVVVTDHQVSAETSDPGTLLRSAAVEYVKNKLRKYLNPSYQES